MTDLGANLAYLGMFAVDPARQAAGLGRELLARAEALARTTFAATMMEMTVIARRTDLIPWYERRGYHRTGEIRAFPDTAVELPMVVLARTLA